MNSYSLSCDGREITVPLLARLARPCVCGVPACGLEDCLWFELGEERRGILYDGGLFSLAFGQLLQGGGPHYDAARYSQMVEDWMLGECWDGIDAAYGHRLDLDDFGKTLVLLGKIVARHQALNDLVETLTYMERLLAMARERRGCLRHAKD